MAKEEEKQEIGEQLDLINVQPENVKAIITSARLYKKFLAARLEALHKEVQQKQRVLELVKEANLQPLKGGIIRFKCDGATITVAPRDEKITIKEDEEAT